MASSSEQGSGGGLLGALNQRLKQTIESDESLKKAFAEAEASQPKPDSSSSEGAQAAEPAKAEPSASADSASAGAADASKESAKPDNADSKASDGTKADEKPKVSRWYRLTEDVKDVLAVAFGVERQRDVEKEYDLGLRAYPWVTYIDPASGTQLYRNTDTGAVTDVKPADFDKRAPPSARLTVNADASAITVTKEPTSAWDRTIAALGATPLIQGMLTVGEAVAASPVGDAARKVKAKVSDAREDLQEKWETSQHPLIVNSAYLVDSLVAETEQGRALREIRALDAGFDEYAFVTEMRDNFIPLLARAFFRLDTPVLNANCKETALAQMKAVAAAREVEGLSHDGTILSVSKVELLQARQLESSAGGTMPLLLTSAQVQYIHAVRDKKGEVVEGSESEIRMAVFVIALTREFVPERGTLAWKAVEIAMHGSQLYL